VCAVVTLTPGASVTLEAIQEFVRSRLAGYKVPRRLVIAEELPILPSGKIDKKRLRADVARSAGG
jgi:acyl-CoA synthetase (AMP-forming)/AMP-acid ligase II